MEKKKRAIKNIMFSIIGQCITICLGLVLPRLYIVSYGSEVNGLLNSINQILVYLSLFEAGIGATSLQALYEPVAKDDWDGISGILSATNKYYKRAGVFYFFALIMLAVIYPLVVNSKIGFITIFVATILSGIGNVIMFCFQGKYKVLFQAEGKVYIITNLSTIITILVSISKIILISQGFDVISVLAVSAVIGLIQTVYIEWYIKSKYPNLNLKVEPNNGALNQKNYMLIHQISGLIFQNTDVLIITVFCGLKVVSVYSIYKLIITHLESILQIFSNGVNFALGQTFQLDKELYIKQIDLFEMVYSTLSSTLFLVALRLFVPFVKLYTRGVNDVQYVDDFLALLFVIVAMLTAMRVPMLLTINYAGHFKQTTFQTVAESIINIAVSIVGVLRFGIHGALIGTVVALLYRTNDVIIYSNVRILKRSAVKTYRFHLINILVTVALWYLYEICCPAVDNYAKILLCGTLLTIISFLCFFGTQMLVNKQERRYIVSLTNKVKEKRHEPIHK